MHKDLEDLWQQTLIQLKEKVQVTVPAEKMLEQLKIKGIVNNNQLTLETSNPFVINLVSQRYGKELRNIFSELLDTAIDIHFVESDINHSSSAPVISHPSPSPEATFKNSRDPYIQSALPKDNRDKIQIANLNPRYTFENFVVGSHNKFAHAIAWRVAESPGKIYNPLFIYGGVGLGKTHLMQAIGHHLLQQNSQIRVTYIASERFMNELINALRDNTTPQFKNRYRNVDLLLIDDIQFIGGKESTQDEFFHTFNELYEAEKQIVISSDRPPNQLSTLKDRLRSRFEMGLITDIQPPELETRVAILKKKAEMDQWTVSDDVLHYIASLYKSNVRELEGAFIRLMAHTSLSGGRPTVQFAQSVLGNLSVKELNADRIQEVTAAHFHLTIEDLKSSRRTKEINLARQVAIFLCCELTSLSTPRLGELFGNRDHTTILHARDKIEALLESDQNIQSVIEEIKNSLR